MTMQDAADTAPAAEPFFFHAMAAAEPVALHPPLIHNHQTGDYDPPPGLKEAMDVAMLLGVPILLTGEPGTGKTQSARWLNEKLGDPGLLRTDVKAATTGQDLLYSFDEVGRFRDGGPGGRGVRPLVAYLRFNPLGEGILRAAGGRAVLETDAGQPLKGEALARHRALLDDAFGPGWPTEGKGDDAFCPAYALLPDDAGFRTAGPELRVVLIDELDKAPRDTPNDLLAEVEGMTFRIPELGLRVRADKAVRPVVVITSNSEKALPAPFLRRCAYFDTAMPGDEALKGIAERAILKADRTPVFAGGGLLIDQSVQALAAVRGLPGLRLRPATGQYLAWLEALSRIGGLGPDADLKAWIRDDPARGFPLAGPTRLRLTLSALLKDPADQLAGEQALSQWAEAD